MAITEALAELDRLVAARPELKSLRPPVACLLRAAFQEPGSVTPALLPDEDETAFLLDRIREGWTEGVPAVRVVSPSIESEVLSRRVRGIDACAGTVVLEARPFQAALQRDPAAIIAWASMLLVEGVEALAVTLEAAEVEASYAVSALRLGLLGEVGDWSGRITSHLAEASWPRGLCPVCGAAPALAEARGLEQRRFLRCGFCAAGWPAARGRCPSCGQSDPKLLRYLLAEQDCDRYRLVLCDACGGRLKVIATLSPLSPPGLVVAELATLHLDLIREQDPTCSG
jgi:hypothetical protein